MNAPILCKTDLAPPPNDWDRTGLPAWAYTSEEHFEAERETLFRRHWQLAGHVANVPDPGDYFCFDVAGERALVVRDQKGVLRAFHNVCRHRGSRLVVDGQGNRSSAMVCPFHGWSFNLDGTFRSAPHPRSLPRLDPQEHGLIPIEMEIWHGFIFVRFMPGDQPAIAEILARHESEVAPYRLEEVEAAGSFWSTRIDANWKCVRDVDNEGYHVAMAHPGLQDLYGRNYFDEAWYQGTNRSYASFEEGDGKLWSVRHYKALLPEAEHLPPSHRRAWLYIGLFPNAVLTFYPDSVGFYQEYPLTVSKTVLRGAQYVLPGENRQRRLARYLCDRINRDTAEEDIQLTVWSNEAAHSSGYRGFILSDMEYGVKGHHDLLRQAMPVLGEAEEPAPGTLAQTNSALLAGRANGAGLQG